MKKINLEGRRKKRNEFRFKNAEGVEFKVLFRKPDKRYYGDYCDGTCSYARCAVTINPDRTAQTQLNTSIHELAHAFFWDKTEAEVTAFANTCSRLLYNHQGWRKIKK